MVRAAVAAPGSSIPRTQSATAAARARRMTTHYSGSVALQAKRTRREVAPAVVSTSNERLLLGAIETRAALFPQLVSVSPAMGHESAVSTPLICSVIV